MLTLSKPISASQAQAYHKSEFANAKENYYTGPSHEEKAKAQRAVLTRGIQGCR